MLNNRRFVVQHEAGTGINIFKAVAVLRKNIHKLFDKSKKPTFLEEILYLVKNYAKYLLFSNIINFIEIQNVYNALKTIFFPVF